MQSMFGEGDGLTASEDPQLQQHLERFLDRYPCDERAVSLLMNLPSQMLLKVMDTFDPRNKEEVDYSRQVTGFIRSLRTQEEVFGARKHHRDEEEEYGANKRLRSWAQEPPAPSEEEIAAFRDRYPMDERAYEYLTSSPVAAQIKVLTEFRPRNEGEPDYSSLVTALVKRARQGVSAGNPARGFGPGIGVRSSAQGPSLEQLREFRDRFPMDERAWEYLLNANGAAQEVVVADFKPRRFDDQDYSAPVTAFVRSMTSRGRADVDLPPCPAKLELFRERFPMDERAFQYLCNASPEMQREVLASFSPKNMDETDFSRQLTGFLNRGFRHSADPPGMPAGQAEERQRRIDWRKVPDIREVSTHRRGGFEDPARQQVRRYGGRLEEFRAQYPMDDRAFDYLLQADREVQEIVLAEFQPKRRHLDGDYSASLTSYVKAVKAKVNAAAPAAPAAHNGGGPLHAEMAGLSSGEQAMLDGFRRRYPMDDRAFQFLCLAEPAVKQKVMESFRPRVEGESDYSGLITSFIKSCKR